MSTAAPKPPIATALDKYLVNRWPGKRYGLIVTRHDTGELVKADGTLDVGLAIVGGKGIVDLKRHLRVLPEGPWPRVDQVRVRAEFPATLPRGTYEVTVHRLAPEGDGWRFDDAAGALEHTFFHFHDPLGQFDGDARRIESEADLAPYDGPRLPSLELVEFRLTAAARAAQPAGRPG